MKILPQFRLSPHRIRKAMRRRETGVTRFPTKSVPDYLDYTIDFSPLLQQGETMVKGSVRSSSRDLKIEHVYAHATYVTAFLSGGIENASYYLQFIAKTSFGSVFMHDGIVSVQGTGQPQPHVYSYQSWQPVSCIPKDKPPLNALKLNHAYLLNPQGHVMVK
ncbi:hypothetical protein COMNV_00874 [Commensalibacter sp. Nvir]|uniref:phage fiber-tail adaptor protein n=1 Tax=Commensalibacter sp. Nvir TaxID=3069817 RepID=UPI002D62E285|nr:hypothetical protein COMNV_00874 [Commensalibacter sp. Nvir]